MVGNPHFSTEVSTPIDLIPFLPWYGVYSRLQDPPGVKDGLWLACGIPWSFLPSGAYGFNSYPSCCSAGVFLSTSRSIIVLIVLVESTLVGSGFLEQFIVIGLVLVLVVISHQFACYLLVARNVYKCCR